MNILATIAQWERDIIAERTRDAMRFMKRNLRLVGAVPFGFDCVDGGELVPNPAEMEVVREALRLRGEGNSYRNIAQALNVQGKGSKTGRRWHPKTIRAVLMDWGGRNQGDIWERPAGGALRRRIEEFWRDGGGESGS